MFSFQGIKDDNMKRESEVEEVRHTQVLIKP